MTTFADESVVCGACGHEFTQLVLQSTNAFGSPDLDTRPPEMQRSTMNAWVQRCPSCGYCARDVTKFNGRLRAALRSSEYRSQLEDTRCPELATTFICAGMLGESSGRLDEAGWLYLHAAWVLDDAHDVELARTWRSRSADTFVAALEAGRSLANQPGASEAILTDCLRRAGRGRDALKVIDRALKAGPDKRLQQILQFQQTLVRRGDTDGHTVEEALSSLVARNGGRAGLR